MKKLRFHTHEIAAYEIMQTWNEITRCEIFMKSHTSLRWKSPPGPVSRLRSLDTTIDLTNLSSHHTRQHRTHESRIHLALNLSHAIPSRALGVRAAKGRTHAGSVHRYIQHTGILTRIRRWLTRPSAAPPRNGGSRCGWRGGGATSSSLRSSHP